MAKFACGPFGLTLGAHFGLYSVSAKNEKQKTTQEQSNHRSIKHVGSHAGKERFSIECPKTKNHTNYLPVQLDYSANLELHF